MTLQVLAEKGAKKTEIARTLGITESTVRYHLRRQAEGAIDGRADKPFQAESHGEVIRHWFEARKGDRRPVNVHDLHEHMVDDHGYDGSYRSVLRYVRARYPRPRIRTYRRVETPPGAQAQTDWGEFPRVHVGRGPEKLNAFILSLSHSRKPAVVWSRRQDELSWLHCHNESFRRLGGIPAVNRIDNVKTAVVQGAGAWGVLHPTYRTYARAIGFHIDACQPREPNAKGKVEAKVRLSRLRVSPGHRHFGSIEELQEWTDERMEKWTKRALCPATGETVQASWEAELAHLASLPILPEPFDVVVTRPVGKDCMVHFENHEYPVPFQYVGRPVEVRGCAGKVQVLADGRVLREFERHTKERILIDPSCYEGEATDRVLPPLPLGKMGRKLQEIVEMPVEHRPLDLYAALTEVAR